MKQERFEEIINNLHLEKNKWLTLSDIDSIILDNGIGIYPDWRHLRFLITEKDEILIKHGTSVPYGAILSSHFRVGMGYMDLSFMPENTVAPTDYYASFRLPQNGDMLYILSGKNIISQAIIGQVERYPDLVCLNLSNPIKLKEGCLLCFYDPKMYSEKDCIHGTEKPGIFMKFTENSGKSYKNLGVFHEIVKFKNIKEINLSLKTKHNIYKLV